MRYPRLKFTIGQMMGVIAVFALIFAVMPAPWAVGFSILMLVFALLIGGVSGITGVPLGRVAVWVVSCYPVLLLASLYATWLTAWCALGHRPRPSLDDPKFISSVVDVPHFLTWLLLTGFLPALLICLALVLAECARSLPLGKDRAARVAALIGVPTLLWASAFVVLRQDPGQVLYWFFD